MNTITIEEFGKIEIRIGTILEAEKVPDADRLIKLIFDFGPLHYVISDSDQESIKTGPPIESGVTEEENALSQASYHDETKRLPELLEKYPGRDVRQIMSAISPFIDNPQDLVGKQIAVCVNLEPRKFRGYESQGMILATGEDKETLSFLVPAKKVEPGSKVH